MSELGLIATVLKTAQCPEDAFGTNSPHELRTVFHQILKVVHPDRNGNNALSTKTTELLTRLKAVADERVAAGTYGKRLPLPEYETLDILADKDGTGWPVLRKPVVGDVADVYFQPENAYGKGAVIKVARSTDDNDLLRAERSALKALNAKVITVVGEGFPKLLDNFQVRGCEANVLSRAPQGFITVQEVHKRLTMVDARSLVWIFKRILSCLDWTHHLGFVHGGILPSHVLLYPDNDGMTTNPHPYKHTARILGWCNSVEYKTRTRLSTWSPSWKRHYPPELLLKKEVLPSSDLYMAAALIVYLNGGTAATLPPQLQNVILKCLREDTRERYQNCGDVFIAWVKAAEATYGHPRWMDFNVPND